MKQNIKFNINIDLSIIQYRPDRLWKPNKSASNQQSGRASKNNKSSSPQKATTVVPYNYNKLTYHAPFAWSTVQQEAARQRHPNVWFNLTGPIGRVRSAPRWHIRDASVRTIFMVNDSVIDRSVIGRANAGWLAGTTASVAFSTKERDRI